ncbi:MAG: helix-turn-helix transcriptional regulator [Gemmatimonadetes bacterium]|nr:helix-turn-helix transcriptional regulator [Gemmatimonadota bacterium]
MTEHGARPTLPARDLQLLLAVVREPLHGYGMMKTVAEQSGGRVRIELGSLYRMIQRLERDGLIVEAEVEPGAPTPGRGRRHYRITPKGAVVVRAELERMRGVLELAEGEPALRGRSQP